MSLISNGFAAEDCGRALGFARCMRESLRGKSPVVLVVAIALAGIAGCVNEDETPREPARLIVDTDMRSDSDDAGALAVAHHLTDRGEAELIGVIASTTGPHVVAAIDAINHYYRRPDIPIGLTPVENDVGEDDFAPTLADTERFPGSRTNDTALDSTTLYRRLLWESADPVTIAVIGFQGPVSALLDSPANHNDDGIPLTGRELVEEKVRELVLMAGHFTDPGHNEWNVQHDIPAARNVAQNWPGPIVYSGFEIGVEIMTGAALTDPETNPVAMAYKLYRWTEGGAGVIGDRHSWDQATVLYAVRGLMSDGRRVWRLSEPGRTTFHLNVPWTRFEYADDGPHRHVIEHMNPKEVSRVIEEMMIAPPGS